MAKNNVKKINQNTAIVAPNPEAMQSLPRATARNVSDYTSSGKVTRSVFIQELCNVPIHFTNYPHQALKEAFPHDQRMWTVQTYFPHGKSGPIYMEEPMNEHDEKIALLKASAIRKAGSKFVCISQTTDLTSVMQQMEA